MPVFLELLAKRGHILTLHAMGTQKEIAEQIRDHGADYLLALQANHGILFQEVEALFTWIRIPRDKLHTQQHFDKGHGRIEERCCRSVDIATAKEWITLQDLEGWKDLKSLLQIQSTRHRADQVETQGRYSLSSLKPGQTNTEQRVQRHSPIS